jgi:hypothetical protein
MLRDPKPLVVGIAWVVECVEQRKRVDETKFLVDVEDMQYGTGTNKVYLPTHISSSPCTDLSYPQASTIDATKAVP